MKRSITMLVCAAMLAALAVYAVEVRDTFITERQAEYDTLKLELQSEIDALAADNARMESLLDMHSEEMSATIAQTAAVIDAIEATGKYYVEIAGEDVSLTSRGSARTTRDVPANDVTAAIRAACPEYTWSDDANMNAAVWICDAESDSRVGIPCADPNSSAMGLGQLTLGNRTKYGVVNGDMMSEIHGMLSYIRDRYGSPVNAWAFWLINEWY